jgi:tetratricopeptide (TPR) repeat protein
MTRPELHATIVAACLHGERPVLFVTGEAGIGKSTLLRSVKASLLHDTPQLCVADVDCSAPIAGTHVGAVEALHPWVSLMRELADEAPTTTTKRLIADLAFAWVKFVPIVGDVIESTVETVAIMREHRTGRSTPEPAVSREHVFHQCIGFFSALAEHQRVIVMIDDAHWADDSSINLLFALARASKGNITCVVAYRPDDVRTSREGGEHALLHVERELTRYALCETVCVDPMSPDDIRTMIGVVSERVDVNKLAHISGGNPLVVQGMVELLPEGGKVDLETIGIPRTAEAIIDERLRRLDPTLRDLLCAAAAEGETFTSTIVRTITGVAALPLAQHLRKAEQDHVLVRSLGKQRMYGEEMPAYEFTNVIVHRALYARLGSEERELMHAAIAEQLESLLSGRVRSEHPHLINRLATHYGAMGDHAKAARLELECARIAWTVFAEQEVLMLLERALARPSVDVDVRASALMLRGTVEQFKRLLDKATQDYVEARALFEQLHDNERIVDIDCRLAACANMEGDPTLMASLAEQALTRAREHAYLRGISTAYSALGIVEETYGRPTEALELFQHSVDAAREAEDDERLGIALSNMGRIYVVNGENERALALFDDAIVALERVRATASVARGQNNAGIALLNLGRTTEAQKRFSLALALHDTIGDVVGASSLRTNLAQLAYREQRWDDAHALIEQSITTKRVIGDHYGLGIALYTRGILRHERGATAEARADLQESLSIFEHIKEQPMIDEVTSLLRQTEINASDT